MAEIHKARLFCRSFSQADRDFIEKHYHESLRLAQKGMVMFKTIKDADAQGGASVTALPSSGSSAISVNASLALSTIKGRQPAKKQKIDVKEVKDEASKTQMLRSLATLIEVQTSLGRIRTCSGPRPNSPPPMGY